MFSEERRDQIFDLLEKEGRIFAKDLAERFDMSIDSIRRDLSMMEEKGLLKRTHGGAIPIPRNKGPRPPEIRFGEANEYENAVARRSALFIQPNDSVFIGGAALHYAMLKYLPECAFTVVTNSLRVADHLRDHESIRTFFIGGQLKQSGNITDSLASEFVKQFHFDKSFLVGGALSTNGLSTLTPEVAVFHRIVANNSRNVYGLATHNKFGFDSFVHIVPLQQIDLIITDEETPIEQIQLIQAKGTEVMIAKLEDNE